MTAATLAVALPLASQACLAQSEQVIRFNGGFDDRAHAIAMDATGAIFVGGSSRSATTPAAFAVVKYSAAGALQWVARYQGVAGQVDGAVASLATDAAGNVYAAGYIARQLGIVTYKIDWLVASFDANGTQRWAHVYNGPGDGYEQASRAVFDAASGALYVTGITGDINNFDWLTIKYSPAGAIAWQRVAGGAANGDDRPVAVKVDGSGNLVVLGYVANLAGSTLRDSSVTKYDAQGNLVWRNDFSATPASDDFPASLAIDGSGDIYVTGSAADNGDPEGPQTPFLAKLTAGGASVFTVVGETAGGSSVALAPDGNVVVAGMAIGAVGSFVRSSVSKFSPLGAQLWTTPVATDGEVNVDADGSVSLGGTRFNSFGYDFYAARLSAGGQKIWERVIADGNAAGDALLAANGDLWMTGTSEAPSTDMLTVRFPKNIAAPALPAAPTALMLAAAKGKLTLKWIDNASNETGFRIERSQNGGAFAEIALAGAGATGFVDSGLNKKVTYAYRVRAYNAAGASAYSNTVLGKPQ
jgi:hypothetical protein